MNDTSSDATEDRSDYGEIRADIEALRREFAKLVADLKALGVERTPSEARRLIEAIAAERGPATEALRDFTRARPLTALAVAFGVGYFGARLISR